MDIGQVVTSSSIGASSTAIGERWVNKHPEGYHKGLYSETVQPHSECYFYDDFWSKLEVTTFWSLQDTGGATELWAANNGCGWAELLLTAGGGGGEVQTAGIDCGDVLSWNLDYGLQFECKAMFTVLPTITAEAWIGVANANVETHLLAGGPTIHAFFTALASGEIFIHTDDNVTSTASVSTGVTLTAGVGHVFRIDFTNPASVRFYIDGTRVCAGTTFNMSAGADVVVQPMIQILKALADHSLGVLDVDYVRIWQERY
jgi:hypothetical protein